MKLVQEYGEAPLYDKRLVISKLLTAAACSRNPEGVRDLHTARKAIEAFVGTDNLAAVFDKDVESGKMDPRDYLHLFDEKHFEVALAFAIASKSLYPDAAVLPSLIKELEDSKNQEAVLSRFPDITRDDIQNALSPRQP